MKILLDRLGTVEGMSDLLKIIEKDSNYKGIMVLACDANGFTPSLVDDLLLQCNKPVWGGIFPGLIHEDEKLQKGTIVVGLSEPVKTFVVKGLNDDNSEFDDQIVQLKNELIEDKTIFVFLDGLSKEVNAFKESLFDSLGLAPNYIGGGAGSLDFIQKPCVFTEQGLMENTAVLALTDTSCGIGVAHGWKPVSEPIKVTEVDHNRIISLDWKPAYDVYRNIVEQLSNKLFKDHDFFEIAKEYPLGINKVLNEMVVRDPIKEINNKEIICVGEIPINSIIYILNGDKKMLLEGAKEARDLAEKSYYRINKFKDSPPSTTFFVDCISRVLFLDSYFDEELKVVKAQTKMFGALTLGEIANTGKAYLEFYNKTSVVGLFGGLN